MFFLDEVVDSPAYTENFQEIEVKDEPMEYDAVSCDLLYHITLMIQVQKHLISFLFLVKFPES